MCPHLPFRSSSLSPVDTVHLAVRGNSQARGMTISSTDQMYTDRFGHEWSIGAERKRGTPRRLTFTCGEFRLIAAEDASTGGAGLTPSRVKDLFCDAERVLVHGSESWYVGYRNRAGRGGKNQAGISTRFRSESGEMRYTKKLLCFRHMPETVLCEQLDTADRVRS